MRDGSYEVVRAIVSAYHDVDKAVLDYHDLNAILPYWNMVAQL